MQTDEFDIALRRLEEAAERKTICPSMRGSGPLEMSQEPHC